MLSDFALTWPLKLINGGVITYIQVNSFLKLICGL